MQEKNIKFEEQKYPPYSITMSVYKNDSPELFEIALNSIINQTVPPNEIVLTVDGPVPGKIEEKLAIFRNNPIIKIVRSEKNQGLGLAHAMGVLNCTHEWIGIMDSDDLSVPNRFELQLKYITEHPETDLLGGQIEEFIGDVNNIVGKRKVPLDNKSIYKYLKYRQPLNHMTFFFRKKSVLDVGNYEHWHLDEDYFLICKMAKAKMVFANLPKTLCYVRVGNEMYARRGSYRYFLSEKKLQDWMFQNHLINGLQWLFNISVRFLVQVILSNNIRSLFFKKVFRNR